MRLLPKAERIDEGRLWTLLAALLVLFISLPVAHGLGLLRFHRLALIVVLVFAAYSVSGQRRVLKIAAALLVPTVVAQIWASAGTLSPALILITLLLSLTFFAFIIFIISASVFRSGEITGDRIAGAICVFLIVGIFWAMIYGAAALYDPAAFNMPEGARSLSQASGQAELDFIYFSFVTLTTLGFGDIFPTTPLSQTLTWLQAVFGQLYIAILLARLVSLHVAQRRGHASDRAA